MPCLPNPFRIHLLATDPRANLASTSSHPPSPPVFTLPPPARAAAKASGGVAGEGCASPAGGVFSGGSELRTARFDFRPSSGASIIRLQDVVAACAPEAPTAAAVGMAAAAAGVAEGLGAAAAVTAAAAGMAEGLGATAAMTAAAAGVAEGLGATAAGAAEGLGAAEVGTAAIAALI